MATKEAKPAGKKWIQGAIGHPGALTKKAKAAGAFHGGKIDRGWLGQQSKEGGTTGKQARLAKTLGKMNKRKGR